MASPPSGHAAGAAAWGAAVAPIAQADMGNRGVPPPSAGGAVAVVAAGRRMTRPSGTAVEVVVNAGVLPCRLAVAVAADGTAVSASNGRAVAASAAADAAADAAAAAITRDTVVKPWWVYRTADFACASQVPRSVSFGVVVRKGEDLSSSAHPRG